MLRKRIEETNLKISQLMQTALSSRPGGGHTTETADELSGLAHLARDNAGA